MNIFEFLGLPKDHRAESKVTQLVKHYDEVVEKNKAGKRLCVQTKKDGVCSLVAVYKGKLEIFSRTGKKFTNTHNIKDKLLTMNLGDGIYMGELTCDLASLEVLSGAVNPNRVNRLSEDLIHIPNNLVINFFDLVSVEAFSYGVATETYELRYNELRSRVVSESYRVFILSYVTVDSEEKIRMILNLAVDKGEEGVVIRDLDAGWVAGHKGYRVMKLVRGVDYDLLCINYEVGTGKYSDKVANLIFKWKGVKEIKCMLGKGWTHDMAKDMLTNVKSDPPIGKIFQVYALEESSKGKLRLPKVGELRHDKVSPDV